MRIDLTKRGTFDPGRAESIPHFGNFLSACEKCHTRERGKAVKNPALTMDCSILDNRKNRGYCTNHGPLPSSTFSVKVHGASSHNEFTKLLLSMCNYFSTRPVWEKSRKFREKKTSSRRAIQRKNVMYIQEGGVKLTVVSTTGKEAVVAILGPGDFVGEGCLAGQTICMATATTIAPTTVLVIEKNEMIRVLHEEHDFSDRFIAYMLGRNIRVEEDLVDQLFNSSEKRLARTLLLLARYGKPGHPQKVLPKVSQEMLAEMIGTTRSRVNFFMNKFRKLGFIQYNGEIHVNNSLLSVVLHD